MRKRKKSPAGKQGQLVVAGHSKCTKFSRILRGIHDLFVQKKQSNKVQCIEYNDNGLQYISDSELLVRIERSKDSRKRSLGSLAGVPEGIFIEAHKSYVLEAERRGLIHE
ncbi:MAG: hypothetical protein EOM50_15845 [Erysipelotrichia bacterium]|nr:hypothetical protein [Erysipelotrichia bacterium]